MYQFSKIFYEADAGAKTGGGATEPLATEPVGTEPQDKTFSQKDVDAIIAKQKTAFERMTEKKLEGFKQAEKLKGMSESERQAEELKQTQERLKEYETRELTYQYEKELTTKGLPTDFAKVIPVSDADGAKAAVDSLAKFKGDIETPLLEKIKDLETQLNNANLRGVTPKAVSGGNKTAPSIPTIF